MKKIIILVMIISIIIGGAYFLFFSENTKEIVLESNLAQESVSTKEELDTEANELGEFEERSVKDRIMESAGAKTGILEDVSGGSSSGAGYILREENMLYHFVEANLPDPAEGSEYEGWLVNKIPTLQFFSTGLMEKEENGMYTLSYVSGELSEGFDFVVITEERVVDETPEKHIIEGYVE